MMQNRETVDTYSRPEKNISRQLHRAESDLMAKAPIEIITENPGSSVIIF